MNISIYLFLQTTLIHIYMNLSMYLRIHQFTAGNNFSYTYSYCQIIANNLVRYETSSQEYGRSSPEWAAVLSVIKTGMQWDISLLRNALANSLRLMQQMYAMSTAVCVCVCVRVCVCVCLYACASAYVFGLVS